MIELVRYLYYGEVAFLEMVPVDIDAKKVLLDNMLQMLFMASFLALDELFARLMRWFPTQCRSRCGEKAFVESYYRIE